MPEEVYWIWIVIVMGIGHKETVPQIENFSSIQEMYHHMLDSSCTFMNAKQKKRALETPLEKAEKIWEKCCQKEINMLTCNDAYYPEILKRIYYPPAILFYKGNPEVLQGENLIAAVGTRSPSEYSLQVARHLYQELVDANCTLVSGCAVGLDTIAHKTSVENGKPTIAVLGCGVDYPYPKGSQELKEQIINNGLLLSEFFPETPPYRGNFPVRNRLMTGISKKLLIIEAGSSSGCLVTASHALEQSKPIYCIPPSDIYSPRYAGQRSLLRDGATPIYGVEDVLEDKDFFAEKKPEIKKTKIKKTEKKISPEIPEKEQIFPSVSENPVQQNHFSDEISQEQQAILHLLEDGSKTVNMLCCDMNMTFENISVCLLEMEMNGWITNTDGFYKLANQ